MKLDLTKFFSRTGKLYVTWLSQSVKRQTNYDSTGTYPPSKTTKIVTVTKKSGKTHQREVGKGNRLYKTGHFAQKAFEYQANSKSLVLRGSEDQHSNGISYADIIAYNDSDSQSLKGKHGSTIRSLAIRIFPWLESDFLKTYKTITGTEFIDDVAVEVKKQLDEQLEKELTKKITVKV